MPEQQHVQPPLQRRPIVGFSIETSKTVNLARKLLQTLEILVNVLQCLR